VIALLAALTLGQAVTAYEQGRLGEAHAALAELAGQQPGNPFVLTWLGAAQMENGGDLEGAERTLRAALKLFPRSWRAHMLLGVVVARQIDGASIFRKLSLASEVKKEFDRAAQLSPGSMPAREALLEYALHAPSIAGGGKDAARAEAERISGIDRFAGLLARARIDGDFGAARQSARTGEQIAALARATRAEADFRAALQARPRDARLWADLGEAQLGRGDASAAVASFREAAAIDPLLAGAFRGLGRALDAEGRRAEARAAHLRFAELAPRHGDASAARRRAESAD
jgi:protein O-GlcNAc transferase